MFQSGGSFAGHWPAGYRALCVRLDTDAVTAAWSVLTGDVPPARLPFDPVLTMTGGLGRSWAELMVSVNRQLSVPNGLLSNPLTAAPLADSLIRGFLLATNHLNDVTLPRPGRAARSASVRAAIDLMEAAPQTPLTLSGVAERCGSTPRGLQRAFQRHVGVSPMAYLRVLSPHQHLSEPQPARF